MNKLIKKVLLYQRNRDDELLNEIINNLRKNIDVQKAKIPERYKSDLEQELSIEIFKGIINYKPKNKIISKKIIIDEINELYNQIIKNRYFESFKNKYKIDSYKSKIKIINEFYLFYNENQFKNYINKICERTRIDFYRTYKIKDEIKIISLNLMNDDNDELLNHIIDPSTLPKRDLMNYELLTSEDISFLNILYKDNIKLAQCEIAKMLGISQQAISKRLNKIKNKLKKF